MAMKTVEKYICDKCGREFDKLDDAKEHELRHYDVVGVKSVKYLKQEYPKRITVNMMNGNGHVLECEYEIVNVFDPQIAEGWRR